MKKIIGFYRSCDLLTMMGTLFSFIGIILAINFHYTFAALCMAVSGICDGFDGKLARKHKNTKEQQIYGVQLDSLSDVICFGVFPAVLTSLICHSMISYIFSAMYMLGAVIRLAYFNMLDAMPNSKKGIFIGVPTTTISFIYPIVLLIVRFISYGALKVVLPILMLVMAILFVIRVELKKVDPAEVLKKIFNKYVVNFFVFPLFLVIGADMFFKINGFSGHSYHAIITTITKHFLPFIFVLALMVLIMIIAMSIFSESKKAKISLVSISALLLFINDCKYAILGTPIELTDVNYLNPDNMAMMGTATGTFGMWIIKVIIKALIFVAIGIAFIKLDKYHNYKFKSYLGRLVFGLGSLVLVIFPFIGMVNWTFDASLIRFIIKMTILIAIGVAFIRFDQYHNFKFKPIIKGVVFGIASLVFAIFPLSQAGTGTFGMWIIRVILKILIFATVSVAFIKLDNHYNYVFKLKIKGVVFGVVGITLLILPFTCGTEITKFQVTKVYQLDTTTLLSLDDNAQTYYDYGYYQGMILDNLGKNYIVPDNYSRDEAMKAVDNAAKSSKKGTWGKANVIFILSEALFDPQNITEVTYDQELMPNIKRYSKDDDKIVTNLLVTPIGGKSVNTEFEILTGSSLAFFKNDFIPYTQYYNKKYKNYYPSIIKELNNNDYETMYLTPWGQTSYKSEYVYNIYGVDKKIYGDLLDINNKSKKKGKWYSDEALMDDIYNELKDTEKGKYKFIMSATAENHFPYPKSKYKNDEYDIDIKTSSLSKEATGMMRAYGQGVYDADAALDYLYKKIQKLDTPTIIVLFGDHLPSIVTSNGNKVLFNTKYTTTDDSNINNVRMHTTKAVVLANYDIDVDKITYLNANYLGAYVLNKLDIEISDYFKFIDYTRKIVPVFNRQGVYDEKKDILIPNNELNIKQKTAIDNFRIVQYQKYYDFK